jgi:hypothetical protein
VVAAQFSGVAPSSHLLARSSSDGLSGAVDAGTVATGVDNTLLVAAARTDSDLQGWAAGPGFALLNACNAEREPDQKLCVEFRAAAPAGHYAGTLTIHRDSWLAGVVAYAPAAAR